jgi:hypothetical protein
MALAEAVEAPSGSSPENESDAQPEREGDGRDNDAEQREAEVEERERDHSATELVEELGRELAALAICEGRLESARNAPEVRRAAAGAGAAVAAGVAVLTAFALANVAAVAGLATVLPTWLAAVVLAVAWAAVGAALALPLAARARRLPLWTAFGRVSEDDLAELAQARDEAGHAVRETLERLGPALAVEVASAAIPAAGDIAGGVVESADGLLEASDDIVESLAAEIPAGGVVNQIWDVVLMPGRFGLRVATTVLRRDAPER